MKNTIIIKVEIDAEGDTKYEIQSIKIKPTHNDK